MSMVLGFLLAAILKMGWDLRRALQMVDKKQRYSGYIIGNYDRNKKPATG